MGMLGNSSTGVWLGALKELEALEEVNDSVGELTELTLAWA